MENKKVIYNEDVERIVNDPKRQKRIQEKHRIAEEKKVQKIFLKVVAFALLAFFLALIGISNGFIGWLSRFFACTFGLYSAVCFGRLLEKTNFFL